MVSPYLERPLRTQAQVRAARARREERSPIDPGIYPGIDPGMNPGIDPGIDPGMNLARSRAEPPASDADSTDVHWLGGKRRESPVRPIGDPAGRRAA